MCLLCPCASSIPCLPLLNNFPLCLPCPYATSARAPPPSQTLPDSSLYSVSPLLLFLSYLCASPTPITIQRLSLSSCPSPSVFPASVSPLPCLSLALCSSPFPLSSLTLCLNFSLISAAPVPALICRFFSTTLCPSSTHTPLMSLCPSLTFLRASPTSVFPLLLFLP